MMQSPLDVEVALEIQLIDGRLLKEFAFGFSGYFK
jgi:hypothetical protein